MTTFDNIVYYLETFGVLDILLPFLLVLTIAFAVLQKIKLFGDKGKRFNIVISLTLAMLFVVPHILGTYPLGYDPVQVMNEALPSVALIAIMAIMMLFLMGLFGSEFSDAGTKFVALVVAGFVLYIFGSALDVWTGPSDFFWWWTPQTTETMLILGVVGLIVWLIFREPKKDGEKTPLGRVSDVLGKMVERKR
jgi:hypothetical protein